MRQSWPVAIAQDGTQRASPPWRRARRSARRRIRLASTASGQWPNWLRHRSPKPAIPGSSPGCPVFARRGVDEWLRSASPPARGGRSLDWAACGWAMTWRTGRSVIRLRRWGRLTRSQRETPRGRVETITSSKRRERRASPTAATGSGSPTIVSSRSNPAARIRRAPISARGMASGPPAFMSAAQARPRGTAGTRRVKPAGDRAARRRSAAINSGESAVRLATTRILALGVMAPPLEGAGDRGCAGSLTGA